MKPIEITLRLHCRDDVPANVVEWMAGNLAEHAENEFAGDYDPEWNDGYEGPPLAGGVAVVQTHVGPIEVEPEDGSWPPWAIDTLNETQVMSALAEIAEVRYAWSTFAPLDNVRVGPVSIAHLDAVTRALLARRGELREQGARG